jgi:hypothetical protein
MKISLTIIALCMAFSMPIFGQTKKNYFPIGTYHQENANIHGVSVGLWTWRSEPRNVKTNGIKMEIIGVGILVALIPRSAIPDDRADFDTLMKAPISERVNGMVISATGTACDCKVNGLSLGGYGQINRQVNGISITSMFNFTQVLNGFQFSLFMNETYKMNGLQLGGLLSNNAHEMNGVQVGVNNGAEDANGVQIGLINKSENLNGIQIGLWNVNQDRKMPLINWHFKKKSRPK